MRLTEEEKKIIIQIGQFYLKKNDGDHDKTVKELTSLGIRRISLKSQHFCKFCTTGEAVEITLFCPGILIGKKGKNIENLEAFLGKHVAIVEAMRETVSDYLVRSLTFGDCNCNLP